jgi:hypothetical protein
LWPVEEHRQSKRARVAFLKPLQQKILRQTGLNNRVDHQDVAILDAWRPADKNLPAIPAAELNVADLGSHKVTNHPSGKASQQVRGEDKGAFEHDHHVHSTVPVVARDRLCHSVHLRCQFPRRVDPLQSRLQISSSAITSPVRVAFRGANCAAGGNPRVQANSAWLVNTGHPARSRTLTRLVRKKYFSL